MTHTYTAWYQACDRCCIRIAGVGIDDLPDGNSYAAWQDDMPVLEYVTQQLEEAGFPLDDSVMPATTDALPWWQGAGMITVPVPLSPYQSVTAPTRYKAAELLVHQHGVTPAEAVKAAAHA